MFNLIIRGNINKGVKGLGVFEGLNIVVDLEKGLVIKGEYGFYIVKYERWIKLKEEIVILDVRILVDNWDNILLKVG